MIIRRIHISSFGPLKDFDCELYSGMNIIRGDNESGKTSLAMFIKFILYGLSGRTVDGAMSERKKYVNWDTGMAEGYIIAHQNGKEYRIERSLSVMQRAGSDKESVNETLTVTDTATGGRVYELEECPGEAMFGLPEQVFVNTVFSGQSSRARIDGADTAAAVENMLFSADETVSVKKAAERLEKFRRTLLHKKGSGGEIAELREKCSELKGRLESAGAVSAEIIELEGSLAVNTRMADEAAASIERQTAALKYYDALCLCRDGDEAKAADAAAAEAEAELRQALSVCCEQTKLEEGRRLAAAIEGERSGAAEFADRLRELEVGAANLVDNDMPADPEAVLSEFRRCNRSAGKLLVFAVILMIFALAAGAAAAVMYAAKSQMFLIPLAGAAMLAVVSGVFFILRGRKFSRMRDICKMFGEEDEDGLARAVDYEMSRRAEADTLSRRAESVRLSLEQSEERTETLETEAKALAASFEDCCVIDKNATLCSNAFSRLRRAIALAERRQTEAEAAKAAYETAAAVAAAKWERIPKDKLAAAAELIRSAQRSEAKADCPESEEAAEEIRRELSFNLAKQEALSRKNHALEVELASKRAVAESPADLWDMLNETAERLKRQTLRHDAAVLASETLAEAGERIRQGIIPRIVRRASKLFADATEGRYESLGSGNAFELSAVINGHTRDSKALSAGTEDLAYVCLRVALATELFGDTRPVLIFDESLAFMDPARSAAAVDVLASSGHQVMLFTCRGGDGTAPTLRLKRE